MKMEEEQRNTGQKGTVVHITKHKNKGEISNDMDKEINQVMRDKSYTRGRLDESWDVAAEMWNAAEAVGTPTIQAWGAVVSIL